MAASGSQFPWLSAGYWSFCGSHLEGQIFGMTISSKQAWIYYSNVVCMVCGFSTSARTYNTQIIPLSITWWVDLQWDQILFECVFNIVVLVFAMDTYINVSYVMEFLAWWVLKSKVYAQKSTAVKWYCCIL